MGEILIVKIFSIYSPKKKKECDFLLKTKLNDLVPLNNRKLNEKW